MLSAQRIPHFRACLMTWYRESARELPWRQARDPYQIWVSEVMLQQTRVAAVLEHYAEFLRRFPTLLALALATEAEVLAAWSGLGYYRRARMLYHAARFITEERGGVLPSNSVELRTLPGVGEYTCAAIASIAFGESIAVVDGNVERVLLRLTGRPEEKTAAARLFLRQQAGALVPSRSRRTDGSGQPKARRARNGHGPRSDNAPGDHNQAMMELGATICLPRSPLCLHCPVFAHCATRGEHVTAPRTATRSQPIAYLLEVRKQGTATEVLLEQRTACTGLMPGMFELPPLPEEAVGDREPVLRVRHAITNTNYYVRVFRPHGRDDKALRAAVPASDQVLHWVPVRQLGDQPLTGLARKILTRMKVMKPRDLVLAE